MQAAMKKINFIPARPGTIHQFFNSKAYYLHDFCKRADCNYCQGHEAKLSGLFYIDTV